jgi:hypothetical protein
MNTNLDFQTLNDLYYKRVFLKEDSNNEGDSLSQLFSALKGKEEKIKEIVKALEPVVDKALEDPEEAANLQPEEIKEIPQESYISEGILKRAGSNIAGMARTFGGASNKDNNLQTNRVNKRYEMFKNKVEKHLRELERDLDVSSDYDQTVKNEIKGMISSLSSEEFGNITPKQSKLGDFRHKLGRGVEWIGKAAALGGIGAVLGAGIAGAVGASGIAAGIIQGAVVGAVRKAGADIINGKKPSAKQVAMQAAIVAALGGITALPVTQEFISNNLDAIYNHLFGGGEVGSTIPDSIPSDAGADIPSDAGADIPSDADYVKDLPFNNGTTLNPEDYFDKWHNPDYDIESGDVESIYDPESDLDISKVEFDTALFNKGIKGLDEWSDGPSPAIVNAASDANLDADDYAKITQKFNELTDEQLKSFKTKFDSNPDKYAKELIKALMKK